MLRFFVFFGAVFVQCSRADIFSQPLGISDKYLTTSVGIGTPPQFFDLGLVLSSDKLVLVDSATQSPVLDYNYDYVKQVFIPEESDTLNVSNLMCRRRYKDPGVSTVYSADGHYLSDIINLGGKDFKEVRFCDLDTKRTAQYVSQDLLQWFMNQPIDGFLGLKPGGENALLRATTGRDLTKVTLYINSKASEPDNSGLITFGGEDKKNCKAFNYIQTEDSDSWSVWVTKGTFNGKSTTGRFSALFDMSVNKLVLPNDIYKMITNYFGGTSSITCSSFKNVPDLQLELFGKIYDIPISEYFVKMKGSNYSCQLNILSSYESDEYQIILGREILTKYCLFLDFEDASIGLAQTQS